MHGASGLGRRAVCGETRQAAIPGQVCSRYPRLYTQNLVIFRGFCSTPREAKTMSPFPFETYAERTAITQAELARYGLLTMLSLAQKPYRYPFSYYGGGYVFCQGAVLTTDGESVTLLCLHPDVVQAQDRSTVDDIRVSLNAEDANTARQLWEILIEGELTGSTVGIEIESHGYTSATFTAIAATLKGVCKHVDGAKMVQRQRIVPPPRSWITCVRPPA